MTLIAKYLTDDTLSDEPNEAKKLQWQPSFYTMYSDERGFSPSLLKCLDEDQAKHVVAEFHLEICGMHIGAHCMAYWFMRVGYYCQHFEKMLTTLSKKISRM